MSAANPVLTGPPRRVSTPGRRLRFCLLTTFYPPYNFGGDGIFVQRLAGELVRRGHHVEVVHSVDAYLALAGSEPAPIDGDGVVVHGLRSRFPVGSTALTHQTGAPGVRAGRIREILDSGFDVIHHHNISVLGGPKVLEYGRGLKLYTPHEYWLVCPTNLLYRFGREPCERRTCVRCTLSYRRPPQMWRSTGLMERAARHVDAFLAPTRFAAAAHAARGFDAPFVQLPLFVPEPSGLAPAPGEPYFLFAGRLEEYKGVQTLIPLFRRRGERLVIAGAGAYERELRRLAMGAPNIEFVGHLPDAELETLYAGALAVLVPSLLFEVSPAVVLESFANGTPVIARDIGALSELVHDSGGGLLYTREDELEAALDRLADQRDELGSRARRAYEETWSPDAHFARYFALIEQLQEARVA
ncbi:MAG: glycosyltransferase family 4 protein [Thermoleophilia bacterium]